MRMGQRRKGREGKPRKPRTGKAADGERRGEGKPRREGKPRTGRPMDANARACRRAWQSTLRTDCNHSRIKKFCA